MSPPFNETAPIEAEFLARSPVGRQRHASLPGRIELTRWASPALRAAATSWFVVAVLGQMMLAIYVVGFYWRAAFAGHFEKWNEVLEHGYIAGDTLGNLVLALHLAFAVVVTVGGPLQLVPIVRNRWPTFHHWNGRVYLASVVVMSLGGLFMIITRGATGDLSS